MEEIKNILLNHLNINVSSLTLSYLNFDNFGFSIDSDIEIKGNIRTFLSDYENSISTSKFILKENSLYLILNIDTNTDVKFTIDYTSLDFPDFVKKVIIEVPTIKLTESINKFFELSYYRYARLIIHNDNNRGTAEFVTNEVNVKDFTFDVKYSIY